MNHRPALWKDEQAGEVLLRLAGRADIVFVGLDEAQALWGDTVTDAAAVRGLLPGPGILVVKDGGREATAFAGATTHIVPALTVRVVEPVGAGDAFAAGFLAGLRAHQDPASALRLGHLTAASALTVASDHGPLPPPERLSELLGLSPEAWAAV